MQKSRRYNENKKLTDVEQYLLNGPVKQVMQIVYLGHYKDGEVVQGKIESGTSIYNGNCTYLFSPAGVKLLEKDVDSPSHYTLHTYNEKGQLLELFYHYSDTNTSRTVLHHNEAGQSTGSTHYNTDGKILVRQVHEFDEEGVMIANYSYKGESEEWDTKIVYTGIGPVYQVRDTFHRKNKSVIKYLSDGSIDHESTWEYDEEGNVIEHVSRYTKPEMEKYSSRTVTTYNSHGDTIQIDIYKSDGSLDRNHTFTHEYDESGNKIVPEKKEDWDIVDYNPLVEGETEKLEYDHHGNWVKRTVFARNLPQYITTRQFTYYGEPSENDPPFEHPLFTSLPEEIAADTSNRLDELTDAQAQWVMEGTTKADTFPVHRYYTMRFKDLPSTSDFNYENLEAIALLKLLTDEMFVSMVHSTSSRADYQPLDSYVLSFEDHPGYLLSVTNISRHDEENYDVSDRLDSHIENDGYLHFGDVELLHPSKDSANYDEGLEGDLEFYIEMCEVEKQPQKPFIHIVEVTGSNYVLKSHPVNDNFEIRDLDINYGSGFTTFHDQLMNRFNSSTKGLVLFHGEPGTGKTYYIRHLLRKMVAHRKKVIYMPPNMVDHLIDPAFMSFLAKEIRHWSAQGQFCVLLIEDAEPLLARRRENVRIQGVTNLLNLSDGLLNDMLNLQIICTFNVDVKKLDSALLRPGRLIARKEFKKLDELDANLLAQRLGIRHHFTEPATLSEVYGMMQNQNTLIHDVSTQDKDATTDLDDL